MLTTCLYSIISEYEDAVGIMRGPFSHHSKCSGIIYLSPTNGVCLDILS